MKFKSMSKKGFKAFFVAETIITALGCALITYFIIYSRLAGGRPIVAYIINIGFIVLILLLDKFADFLMTSKDFLTKDRGRIKNFLAAVLFAAHCVSFKTGLYLFYIIMLIVSRVSILEPGIISPYLYTFIRSVEYGVVLLLPLDKFIELLTKDDRRFLKIMQNVKREEARQHRSMNLPE